VVPWTLRAWPIASRVAVDMEPRLQNHKDVKCQEELEE
jgi:hypothetical protein